MQIGSDFQNETAAVAFRVQKLLISTGLLKNEAGSSISIGDSTYKLANVPYLERGSSSSSYEVEGLRLHTADNNIALIGPGESLGDPKGFHDGPLRFYVLSNDLVPLMERLNGALDYATEREAQRLSTLRPIANFLGVRNDSITKSFNPEPQPLPARDATDNQLEYLNRLVSQSEARELPLRKRKWSTDLVTEMVTAITRKAAVGNEFTVGSPRPHGPSLDTRLEGKGFAIKSQYRVVPSPDGVTRMTTGSELEVIRIEGTEKSSTTHSVGRIPARFDPTSTDTSTFFESQDLFTRDVGALIKIIRDAGYDLGQAAEGALDAAR